MPITRSAIKKMHQDKKRRSLNVSVKTKVKEAVKLFRKSPAADALPKVSSLLDTAVKKHIFHANKADRLKSRLSKLLVAGHTKSEKASPAKKATAKKAPAKKTSRAKIASSKKKSAA